MDIFHPENWQTLDALFDEALARPPDERTALLRARCGDDVVLYEAVEALLVQEAEAEKALGNSATDFAAPLMPGLSDALASQLSAVEEEDLPAGTLVGPYRIVAEIGRGGMGAVYRAARADGAFEKEVALKLVKRGMDTDEALRRFRYERQILAGLDHPNIARLLDAGVAEDGRPFLVMELAEGESITAYRKNNSLALDARLALFEQVCEAVAYAHRHLVVHRDLKPSNILVTDTGEVKLLDFGIAKLLGDDDGGLTRLGTPMTPEYAAPEQRNGGAITTATDVYALGVVLYEMLTGVRPEASLKPPSAVVADDRLRRSLRGDLDTLTLAALHTDPPRRYSSAEALLDDLRRLRNNLPLHAKTDSSGYRLRKFVARHRVGVGLAVVGFAVSIAFVSALAMQQRRTATALDESEATASFLESLFAAADPYAAERLDTLRAADLLARGVERAQRDLGDQPTLRARLLSLIGETYARLNLHEEARPLLEDALKIRLQLFGPGHESTAETQHELGILEGRLGSYEEAEAHLSAALATYQRELGPEHEVTLRALKDLAVLYEDLSRYDEAETILRELQATQRRRLGSEDPELAATLYTLALVLRDQERFDEAEPIAREALAIQHSSYGEEHPTIATTLNELGAILRGQGNLEAAEEAYRMSLSMFRRLLGNEHRETEIGRTHLAELLRDKGQYAESAALYSEVLEHARQNVGEDHPGVGIITALLAGVLLDAERLEEAEATYREALTRMARSLPPGHVRIARATAGLGATLTAQGRLSEAEAALLESVRLFEAGEHDPSRAHEHLASLYDRWERPVEVARWRDAVAIGTE